MTKSLTLQFGTDLLEPKNNRSRTRLERCTTNLLQVVEISTSRPRSSYPFYNLLYKMGYYI